MKTNLFKRLFSSKGTFLNLSKGFTLIELLIVIAVIGVLAAGILVLIDPIDKIAAANDAKVQNDVSGMGRASEAYATVHLGFYPATINALFTSGELKRVPVPPGGYGAAYGIATTPGGCVAGVSCTRVIFGGSLRSKKFTQASPATPFWNFDTSTGKSCATAAIATGCP